MSARSWLAGVLGLGLALGPVMAASQAPDVVGPPPPVAGSGPGEEFPVFRALERLALDRSQPRVQRLAAIGGLAQAAHPAVVASLVSLLGDPDPEIRARAARALGWPGNAAAVAGLAARAGDPAEVPSVRAAAIAALGRIGDPAVASSVEAWAGDGEPQVRREASLVLIETPVGAGADRVAAAIRLLRDLAQDGQVRALAALALGASGDARALDPLVEALEDRRPPAGYADLPAGTVAEGMAGTFAQRLRSLHNVRAHAAVALGRLGDRRAVPPLLKALADPDPVLRTQAAAALGRLKAGEAVPSLIGALQDTDAGVRQTAATALGIMGDPSAVPSLVQALQDAAEGVRARAAAALGRLGDPAARSPLARLAADDPVPQVRQAAREALDRLGRP